jgi:leader peptidase (prepilin peptidase)/N-methyltransferase
LQIPFPAAPGPAAWLWVWWAAVGLIVGSFLNVAIHRYPLEGESISHPRRSRCPSCKTPLGWKENIPLVSWALQAGRCRHCGWKIPVRYPLVEALTAVLFLLAAWGAEAREWPIVLVRAIVLAGLVVATFVDLDCFEIPDQVSIGGMVLAPIVALLLPEIHASSSIALRLSEVEGGGVDRFGSLMTCLAGMATGGGILWTIGWAGKRVLGKEAMGFGDVKLLAAGGGFVGPGGVLLALLVASFVASVVGVANILRVFIVVRGRARDRGRKVALGRSYRVAHVWGGLIPFGPYLALGIGIALLYWNDMPW